MFILYFGLIIYFFIGLTNVKFKNSVVCGFLYKHNTSPGIIYMLSYLIVLMGGSSLNSDTKQYTWIWEYDFFSKDPGFGLIVLIAKRIGMSLIQFRLVLAIVGILLIYFFCKKYLNIHNQKLFLLFYIVYPFLWDATQLRNYIGMAIFLHAFLALTENSKKGLIKYVVLTIIAASMQKTFIFYLPLVFYNRISRKKLLKLVTVLGIILGIVLGVNRGLLSDIAVFLLRTVSDNLSGVDKFLSIHTRFGWAVHWIMALLTTYLLYECKKKYLCKVISDNEKKYYLNLSFWTSMYCLFALPLYVLSVEFFRIERNIHLLLLVAIGITLENKKINKVGNRMYREFGIEIISFIVLILLIVIFQYLYDYSIFNSFTGYWKYNWILGGN